MRVGGIALSVRFEDVVHHREAQAAHEFVVELQVTVAQTVAESVKVVEQMLSLLVGKRYHGVLVQRNAAANAVVVRGQLVLQELNHSTCMSA